MNTQKVILFSTAFLLLTLFVAWYVGQEHYIYSWDYETYHRFYRDLGTHLRQSPVRAISSVVNSVRNSDYNMLPTLFLMPFYFSFGSGRLAYILSIGVLFAFPTIVLFTWLMKELQARRANEKEADALIPFFIAIAIIGFSPQFWAPVLLGYVDVVGLAVIFIVLTLYFRKDLEDHSVRSMIALGLLLSLIVLLRRWYAYWVAGFLFAMFVTAWVGIRHNTHPIAQLRRRFQNLVVVGTTAFFSFFTLATPLAERILTTDYRDIHSAYRGSDSLLFHLSRLSHQYGLLFLTTSVLGLIRRVAIDEEKPVALFLAVQFVATFLLFTRTQLIDIHHYYWVSSILFIFAAFFWQELYGWLKGRVLKAAVVSSLIAVCLLNSLIVFHRNWNNLFGPADEIFPQLRRYPLERKDLDQVHQLLLTLNDLTRNSDNTIYVLASSIVLNGSIVRSGCSSFESALATLEQKILITHDVDKRDGFPFHFFNAQYVIVTNPVSYSLAPQDQRVVGVLAEQLLNGEQVGQAYEKLPFEFALEDDSRAYIYKKTKNFDAAALKHLSDTFVELYPSYRKKFELTPETIRALSSS